MLAFLCPGIAAATIFSPSRDVAVSQSQLRVAFDGDAVLFSDESERIVKAHGLDRFFEHEKAHENKPLAQVLHTLPGTLGWSKEAPQNLPLAGTSSPEPNPKLSPESSQLPSLGLQPSSLSPDPWVPSVSFYLFFELPSLSLHSHPPFEAHILSLSPSLKPLPLLCSSVMRSPSPLLLGLLAKIKCRSLSPS